jgi:hypothetical protein
MSSHHLLKTLVCVGMVSVSANSAADPTTVSAETPAASVAKNLGPFAIVEPKTISEFWLNPGFYSYHFKKDVNLNNYNLGLGGEYRYSTTTSVEAGEFHNSDWKRSYYVGWNWQPLELGSVRLGGAAGLINGYPKAFHGSWFPAVLPQASFEHKNMGANIIFTPGYKDRLYAALSFQFKMKLY